MSAEVTAVEKEEPELEAEAALVLSTRLLFPDVVASAEVTAVENEEPELEAEAALVLSTRRSAVEISLSAHCLKISG